MANDNCRYNEEWVRPYQPNNNYKHGTNLLSDDTNKAIQAYAQRLVEALKKEHNVDVKLRNCLNFRFQFFQTVP